MWTLSPKPEPPKPVVMNSDTLFGTQGLLWDGQAYLDKPFTRRALLEAVSMLLHGTLQHCGA
jgi:hypothetical protein